jgi:hypothetical protein
MFKARWITYLVLQLRKELAAGHFPDFNQSVDLCR